MNQRHSILLKPETAGAEHSKYLIHSRLEIAAILNGLRRSGRMVTAYFGPDDDFFLTSIIDVNPERDTAYIDCGTNSPAGKRALQARDITFVAMHERIKIQFAASSLSAARLEGRDVFSMPIPQALLRLQRREYFRITTPLTRPLVCVLGPQATPEDEEIEAVIVDISCGGVALVDPGPLPIFDIGARLSGCRIPLPEIGAVGVDIVVKSTNDITLKNGKTQRQAGCEFVDMRERDRNLIQRYISRLERELKARGGAR